MKIILLILLCLLWLGLFFLPLKKQPPPTPPIQLPEPTPQYTPPEKPVLSLQETLLLTPLPAKIVAAKILISKSKRQLDLYSGEKILRRYNIGLGFSPTADKIKEGDGATPEGEFYIFTKNPNSAYYLSLGISYPNIQDAERGLKTGLINQSQYQQIIQAHQHKRKPPQNTALGGLIYIHGHGAWWNWTRGCVALNDKNMKELFDVIEVGTPVVITR